MHRYLNQAVRNGITEVGAVALLRTGGRTDADYGIGAGVRELSDPRGLQCRVRVVVLLHLEIGRQQDHQD